MYAADSTSPGARSPRLGSGSGPIGAAILGYVAQPEPLELRAILGVPGSAVFSDPLTLPPMATRIQMAPNQMYALVDRLAGGPVILTLGSKQTSLNTLTGAVPGADVVAFSPTGQAMVLYSAAGQRMQVITGLPDKPQMLRDVVTGKWLEQPVGAAVSDDGASVLITSAKAVYEAGTHSTPQQLISVGSPAAMTFLTRSGQAAIADRSAGSIYLWPGDSGVTQWMAGIDGIGELRSSADGQGLWLTKPGANSVSWIGIQTQEARTVEVPVSPVELQSLAVRDMFLLSSDAGQPAWILFQQEGSAVATFVPAARRSRIERPLAGVTQ